MGTWVTVGHPDVPDIMEALGFDWVVFDTEHAPIGPESLASMIQALDPSKMCPLVRVGQVDQYLVKSALDMGAHGIVCPLVSSPREAASAVRFAKYPPLGVRGVAPRKAAEYGLRSSEYLGSANRLTVVAVQIETKEAVADIDSITAEAGVDIAFVGPTDLTFSLGLGTDRNNPKVLEAMGTVLESCARSGKVPGILASTPDEAMRAVEMGFRFVGLGSDVRFMIAGAKLFLDEVEKYRKPG